MSGRLQQALREQVRRMLVLNPSLRPWHFPLVAGLCTGLPVLLGAWLGRLDLGVLGSLGGMVILYLPQATVAYRLVTLVVCGFGFATSFTLAALAGGPSWVSALVLGLVTMLINLVCRFYSVAPPGRFFFVMIASLASTASLDLALLPEKVGVMVMGSMLACLLVFGYSLLLPAPPGGREPHHPADWHLRRLWLESLLIGALVGGSFLLALLLGLDNPYWVPISCAAVLQGNSVSMLIQRKLHRILGTAVGLVLAWLLFSLPPDPWLLATLVILLNFAIETLVTRNYGLAVVFITPLTVLLAGMLQHGAPPEQLVLARMVDILLGSLCGLLGGSLLQWLPSPRRS